MTSDVTPGYTTFRSGDVHALADGDPIDAEGRPRRPPSFSVVERRRALGLQPRGRGARSLCSTATTFGVVPQQSRVECAEVDDEVASGTARTRMRAPPCRRQRHRDARGDRKHASRPCLGDEAEDSNVGCGRVPAAVAHPAANAARLR
jgi:hypothetical protein